MGAPMSLRAHTSTCG